MARMASAEHDADWVINNDADEFWWPRDGTLAAALASVPARYDSVLVERYNFIARPESDEPFYARMTHRYAVPSNPAEGRPLQPKTCHRGHPQVTVAEGNHQVDWPGRGLELTEAGMEILHYPVRSRAQFQNKVVMGGEALERNRVLPAGIGRRWRDLLEIHRAGRFDETYATYVPDEAQLADAVRDGSVVTDRRLADFFAAREVDR